MIFLNENIVYDVLNKNKQKINTKKNLIYAFLFGGLICLIGEIILSLSKDIFKLDEKLANNIMYLILILSSCLLTGLGLYDKIGAKAGAGTILPITGFANSMSASAIESKPEGLCCGIFMNIFKLAGSVISASVIFGIICGILYLIGSIIW